MIETRSNYRWLAGWLVPTLLLLISTLLPPATFAQANPSKLAVTARFDLTASPGTGSIHSAEMPVGDGSFQRMSWLPADEQPRTYTVEFPTPHFAWSDCIFKFTPAASGTVELRLMGPWEEPSPGNIYRQETIGMPSRGRTRRSLTAVSKPSLGPRLPVGRAPSEMPRS